MTTGIAQIVLQGVLAALLLTAMVTDWRRREIDNWLTALVALLAPLWWWSLGWALWPDAAIQAGLFGVVLAIGIGLFALGAMGGGDVKLLAALALWLPPLVFLNMAIVMSLIGGALTIAMLVWHRRTGREGNPEIPYGLAIAAAALWVLAERNLNQFA